MSSENTSIPVEIMNLGELMSNLPCTDSGSTTGELKDEDEEFLEQIVPRTPNISSGAGYDSEELDFLKSLEQGKKNASSPGRKGSIVEQIVRRNMRSRARMLSMERRGSVQSVPLPPSLADARTFAKKDSVLNFLQDAISSHFLFTELESKSIYHMAKSMRCRTLRRGEYVIKGGDSSRSGGRRCIHIVEKGTAILEEDDVHNLKSPTSTNIVSGDVVGDEDFLFDAPRSRGVKVTSDSMTVWSLRRDVYYEYKKSDIQSNRSSWNSILLKVAKELGGNAKYAHDVVPNYMYEDFMMQTIPKGVDIIKQGERGHMCYILAQGDVQVTVDDKPVKTLHAGSYFGNRALLSEDCVRTATCTTMTKVRLWSIDRLTFQTIMRRKGETEVRMKQKNKMLHGSPDSISSGRKRSKSETFVIPVPKLSASSFRVVKTLGKGAYGEVVLARYDLSSEAYVLS